MSHKEHILAFLNDNLQQIDFGDSDAPRFNPNGYTPRSNLVDDVLFTQFHAGTEVIWRETAEYWNPDWVLGPDAGNRHRQVLPYALLTRIVDNVKQYGVYQRVKGIGEERLLKGHTMGFGGHLPGIDVKYDQHSGIDVWKSIVAGLAGEMQQEAGVDFNHVSLVSYVHKGYIMSTANEVDSLHFAIVMEVLVDPDYPVSVNEKGLDFKGWFSKEEVLKMHEELPKDVKFENWTRFIIEADAL